MLGQLSQCSTVVRNTVVRATIKVNGKPQISGTRSPLTPQSIALKFDTGDSVGPLGHHVPKMVKLGPVFDFLGGLNFDTQFSLSNPQNRYCWPIFGLRKSSTKRPV